MRPNIATLRRTTWLPLRTTRNPSMRGGIGDADAAREAARRTQGAAPRRRPPSAWSLGGYVGRLRRKISAREGSSRHLPSIEYTWAPCGQASMLTGSAFWRRTLQPFWPTRAYAKSCCATAKAPQHPGGLVSPGHPRRSSGLWNSAWAGGGQRRIVNSSPSRAVGAVLDGTSGTSGRRVRWDGYMRSIRSGLRTGKTSHETARRESVWMQGSCGACSPSRKRARTTRSSC